MKKMLAVLLASLATLGTAVAADTTTERGITTSTDPAKAAEVERHAEALKAQQAAAGSQSSSANASGTSGTKHSSKHKRQKHKGNTAKSSKQTS